MNKKIELKKSSFLVDTPQSPKGDLLKFSSLSPPWGGWGVDGE